MPGHHVAWVPDDGPRLATALHIRSLILTMPASRVAALLTEEGVPAPDSGRWRKDNGIEHPVSGVWHQSTVVAIGRNALLAAITTYQRAVCGSTGGSILASQHVSEETTKVARPLKDKGLTTSDIVGISHGIAETGLEPVRPRTGAGF